MANKIIDGTTLTTGYVLNSLSYSGISITSAGGIIGQAGSAGANPSGAGTTGGVGLKVTFAATGYNQGILIGGAGGSGGSVQNSGSVATITSGAGGGGGAGAAFTYDAVLENGDHVTGGAGGAGGSAVNTGTAFALAGAGGYGGAGVYLAAGATLANTGTVTGGLGGTGGGGDSAAGGGQGGTGGLGGAGVYVYGSGAVTNTGVIMGGGAGAGGGMTGGTNGAKGVGGDGVDLDPSASASVVNGTTASHGATIEGAIGVYAGGTGAATVTNFGTIEGTSGLAVQFTSSKDHLVWETSGTFVGSIAGGGGTLEIAGGVDELNNLGGFATLAGDTTFSGFGTYVVDEYHEVNLYGASTLTAGKSFIVDGSLAVFNGHTFVNNGSITAYDYRGGLYAGGASFVTNGASGVITGLIGVYLAGGSHLMNLGSIRGSGTLSNGVNIQMSSGVIFNGSAADTTASIDGYDAIFAQNSSGSVHNYATIIGTGGNYAVGAVFAGGGTLVNGSNSSSKALIEGTGYGVQSGEGLTLNNYGSITEGAQELVKGAGVYAFGGTITNAASGFISGYVGVSVAFPGYVDNLSTIVGMGAAAAGVAFGYEAQLVNGSASNHAALIKGDVGVTTAASWTVTVTNSGTIQGTGGVSVSLAKSTDLLIADQYAQFLGKVLGGGGSLELSGYSIGTLSGLGGVGTLSGGVGMSFSGFNSYYVDVGTSWTVKGANTLVSGATLTARGAFDIVGTLDNHGSIIGNQVTVQGVGGRLINEAAGYVGTAQGVYAYFGGGVTNLGTIFNAVPAQQAVRLGVGGGALVNGSAKNTTALVESYFGVYGGADNSTVTNFGAIEGTGGASVKFINPTDRLIAEAGSAFIGQVEGGGGTLEQAGGAGTISIGGTGTISGPEAVTFSGFGTYQLDAGAWTLAAASTIGGGQTVVDLAALGVSGVVDSAGTITAGAKGTVTINGSLIGVGSVSALDTASTGSVRLANGAVAQIAGPVANQGTISLLSSTLTTDLRVLAAGATLSGAGKIALAGTKGRILGATAASTLTNVDNTISGAGELGANSLTLINQSKGVVDAVGAVLTVATKGEPLTNQGLMEATGGGTLVLADTTIANAGGTIAANSGAPVKLQDDVIDGGATSGIGTGVVKVNLPGGEFDGVTSAVSLSGFIHIVSTSNEILEGSIVNSGKLNLTAGSKTCDLIIGAAGATLSGGGQVNLSNSLGNRIYGQASGDTLTNVDNRIDGAGLIGNGTMTLINEASGQILGNQNLSLTLDTGTNAITNAGIIENVGKGGTLVKSAVNNTGMLEALTAGTLTLAGTVTGAGVATINGGTLFVEQAFAEKVTFTGSTGTLKLGDSQAFTGKVAGLSTSSLLDLADISFFSTKTKATYSGTSTSGTLVVTDGTHTAHINLIGDYLASTWSVSGDGHGGTRVFDPTAAGFSQAMASVPPTPATSHETVRFSPPPRLELAHAAA